MLSRGHLRPPHGGWIRVVRDAMCMNGAQLAQRMGIRQPTLARLEQNERDRTITLGTLDRAAAALGCDLVYVFVPRDSLVGRVERQARLAAEVFARRAGPDPHGDGTGDQEGLAIEDAARELLAHMPRRIWGGSIYPELVRFRE
jgi:predicted DNA-binding mobile mystery protein A